MRGLRRSGMRTRVVVVAVLLVVTAACGEESLPELPVAATDSAHWAPYPGAYRFGGELPNLPDTAPAYRLEAAEGARTVLAEVLGEPADGIQVSDQPGRPWQLNRARDVPISSDPPCPDCAPLPRAPGLLSDEAAEQKAREILAKVGVSGGEAEIRQTPVSMEVTIRPTVGGLPTVGWEHHVSLGIDGIPIGGFGWLGLPQKLGDYPLVPVQEAVERMKTAPRTLMAPAEPADTQEVVLRDVDLVLEQVEGRLVPAFRFEAGPIVPAVVDRLLEDLAPEPGPVPPDGGSGCGVSGQSSSEDTGNEPMTVEVCGPESAEVGEEVVFDVTATDPDAEIIESGCGGPTALFGDEEGAVHAGCMPACAAPLKDGNPGKFTRTFRHTYAKPGTYTARFTFQSAFCTTGSSTGEGTLTVTVK